VWGYLAALLFPVYIMGVWVVVTHVPGPLLLLGFLGLVLAGWWSDRSVNGS
jgi:hypothetical protein